MKNFWKETRLSDKILAGLLALAVIGWSATTINANITNGNKNIEIEPQTEAVEISSIDMITVVEAREIAIDLVGGGTVNELNLNIDEATFDIVVYYNREFQITLDATNGALILLESLTTSSDVAELSRAVELSENLTSEQAIELAREHLVSIGNSNATLVYSYSVIENSIPVWSIEFRYNGHDLEFYVEKATGNFLKSPQPSNSNNSGGRYITATSTPTLPTSDRTNSGGGDIATPTPSTPTVTTREQAGEIALLLVPNGILVEIDNDFERGRAVWYVAIRDGHTVHEIYVDRENGNIVLHETYRD